MKRLLTVLTVLIALSAPGAAFSAPGVAAPKTPHCQPVDQYDDSQSSPLRIIAYIVHPVGYALEWAIFRPIHWVVAQPSLVKVFGHTSHDEYAFDEHYL